MSRVKKILTNNGIIIALTLMVVVVIFMRPAFLSGQNFINISMNTAIRFIIALGVSGILIIKGTDLSAGRIVGFSAVLSVSLLQDPTYSGKYFSWLGDYPVWGVCILVILVAAVLGLMNGVIVSILKVPPFIATLGTQTIVYGINLLYSKAQPLGNLKPAYQAVSQRSIGPVSYLVIFATILGTVFWVLYNKTKHGKYMYAIGGNEVAAEVSGINVRFSKIKIFILGGALYGFAGFLLASRSGGATVNTGLGYELEAIAACTIGGVSTTGGVGKVSGVLIGVLIFELMKTSLQFLSVNQAYQEIIKGLIIVAAVAIDIRKYIAKK